jgi:hypothetical protein
LATDPKKTGDELGRQLLSDFYDTEALYAKWTEMRGFQRTRGVLRTFALALREAANWDDSPLVGPAVLLDAPGHEDLSKAMRQLVTVADTEEHEGRKTAGRRSWSASWFARTPQAARFVAHERDHGASGDRLFRWRQGRASREGRLQRAGTDSQGKPGSG